MGFVAGCTVSRYLVVLADAVLSLYLLLQPDASMDPTYIVNARGDVGVINRVFAQFTKVQYYFTNAIRARKC